MPLNSYRAKLNWVEVNTTVGQKNGKLPPLVCALVLAGCNAGTMVHDQYDAKTGQLSRTVYAMYYDDGAWIIPHHLA